MTSAAGTDALPASTIHVTVNGVPRQVHCPDRTLLVDLVRDALGLTGTHGGCLNGDCGACTVLVDGRPVLSCILRAEQAEGCAVTTIEGLGDEGALSLLQRAFVEEDAFQCGFCTPGQVVSATALLAAVPRPTSDQVRLAMSGNLCRCGAYAGIERAILRAAEELAG
jgi:aerobic-type carbon monoxide dehydrogenase small subunit (CoxS/CutS family)